jgi:hypothetical protein
MYVPVGQRGQGASQAGAAQQQAVAQQGGGIAASIRAADASLQAKKKEARRIYERAETQMRTDLNDVAAFDASAAGTDAAPAIQAAADDLRSQIMEANDPVKARQLIAEFKQKYNLLKAREDQRVEDSSQLNSMSTMTGSEMAGLNSALAPGMEYDEVDAGTVARADQAFRRKFEYVDGKIMVQGPEGNLVPLDEAEFINDTSMYQPSQRKVDVGDLQTSAMSEAVQTRIVSRSGEDGFKEEAAEMEYDTLAENNNRSGVTLRMQINEDYLDESGNSRFFDSQEEAKAFEIGPNGFDRIKGNPDMEQAWRDVWGEPGAAREKDDKGNVVAQGTGWELLNTERSKFVEYARTAYEAPKKNKGTGTVKDTPSRYAEGTLAVTTDQRMQDALASGVGASESATGYTMTSIVDPKTGDSKPIKISGSELGYDGEYLIQGFGVDPLYGITAEGVRDVQSAQPMASVTVEVMSKQYEGPNGKLTQEQFDALPQNEKILYEEEEVRTTKQKRIPIGPGSSIEGQAIWNRVTRDPEAMRLIQKQQVQANQTRSDYLVALSQGLNAQQEREAEAQNAANQAAEDADFEEQQRRDRVQQDLRNESRQAERAKIVQKEAFTDGNIVKTVAGRPVYFPPPNSEVRDGKWYYQNVDEPIGKAYRYEDSDGSVQIGMRPLK